MAELSEPIATKILETFFIHVKTPQMLHLFQSEVLSRIKIEKINQSKPRQFLFSNTSAAIIATANSILPTEESVVNYLIVLLQ